jgi:hypothetical protein
MAEWRVTKEMKILLKQDNMKSTTRYHKYCPLKHQNTKVQHSYGYNNSRLLNKKVEQYLHHQSFTNLLWYYPIQDHRESAKAYGNVNNGQ